MGVLLVEGKTTCGYVDDASLWSFGNAELGADGEVTLDGQGAENSLWGAGRSIDLRSVLVADDED